MIDAQLFLQPQLAYHRNSTLSKLQKVFLGLSAYPTENSLLWPLHSRQTGFHVTGCHSKPKVTDTESFTQ